MKHTFLFGLIIFLCVHLLGCGQFIDEDETGEESIKLKGNQKDDEEKLFDYKI